MQQLTNEFKNINLKVIIKLGGETSFDIYPEGWDKTYCLKHFSNYETWFVGDKCHEGGNDEEIYKALLPNSYSVKNTKETFEILKKFIIPKVSEGETDER